MLRLYGIPIQEKIFPYIPYILLSLVTFVIIYILYFKSKNKFWLNQVIHNKYDPRLWNKIGIITDKVKVTKYYEPLVYSTKWNLVETQKKELMCMLISSYYQYYKDLDINVGVKNMQSMFVGHNKSVYVSMYFKNALKKGKLIGGIISKPIEGRFHNNERQLYFWDYMCSNKDEKHAFFKLMFTHYKRSRDLNISKYYLFRTSSQIEIATSLVSYYSYLVSIKFFPKRIYSRCKNVQFILIDSSNYRLILELYYKLYEVYNCFLHVNISQLKKLLDSKEMYWSVILLDNKPIACYFFKQIHSRYNNNPVISLIGSYQGTVSEELYLEGFYNSIILIYENYNYSNIVIDDLNQNKKILEDVKKYKVMERYKSYYYFYNYAHPGFSKEEVLMLV